MKLLLLLLFPFCAQMLLPSSSFAWGRRGHTVICEAASLLAAPNAGFLKSSSYDLGYYCNVPDLAWKKGELYKVEWTNHFMDLEIFERAFRSVKSEKPFELDRVTFDSKYPFIKQEAGRAWWRIQELNQRLQKISQLLRDQNLKDRHSAQADWLVTAGAIGHYVGDLSQPLHVTENFDGELTHQKGIHSFYEDAVVDELYSRKDLLQMVLRKARKKSLSLKSQSTLELVKNLSEKSSRDLPALLALDLKVGRTPISKIADAHEAAIVEQMAEAALVLAELWSRELEWKFDGHRFFNFEGTPNYIVPPKAP